MRSIVSLFPARLKTIDLAPYLVGAGLGVLCWIAFAVAKEPLGVTTALSRIASLFALPFMGSEGVAQNAYWKPMPLSLDYGVVFLGGLMLGAFLSASFSGKLKWEAVPERWRARFGNSVLKRFVAAFIGGALVMFGARLAGGCTSGHALSGGLQLAVSSWVFIVTMFASGVLAACAIFGCKSE